MKMTTVVKNNERNKKEKPVINFMGGISYELNPIDTLKMITASSIFGEPQYYRAGEFSEPFFELDYTFKDYAIFDSTWLNKKTSTIMEEIIDKALDYDFKATLEWAVTLRKDFLMRLNPQVIMVRAAIHPKKEAFMAAFPGLFAEINAKVMQRADEPISQLTYYLFKNKSHKNMPNILKRTWAKKISGLSAYEFNKYKNTGLGMKDIICLCHPKSAIVDNFMKTGKVDVPEFEKTWEQLKSAGNSWKEVLETLNYKIPHMALLRNIRGIFTEINDEAICDRLMNSLKKGVENGKQFPFRYWSALKTIANSDINHKVKIMDTLEECVDIALTNMPKLKGKTMCLSDNSGSAWGTFNSDYGSVTVAEIGNLSSLITAKNSDEGYVGLFGDNLIEHTISKRNGILIQAELLKNSSKDIGTCTENGIWLFLDRAIKNKEHWDNIFIYSDMQAGHGGLYGENSSEYAQYTISGRYIDVNKLLKEYRQKVNPKVNVFMVQTAGYTNALIPEYGYRTNILYGWTGKELEFAKTMIDFWDEKENKKNN